MKSLSVCGYGLAKRFCVLFMILASCHEEDALIVPEQDAVLFNKLKMVADEAELLWPGYDYLKTKRAYIILLDVGSTNVRGYFLNPNPIPNGSIKLNDTDAFGLDLYRNDHFIDEANEVLGEDGIFDFGDLFVINGEKYFLVRDVPNADQGFYLKFKDIDSNLVPLIMVHELFHTYQIAGWTYPAEGIQDFLGYPLTIDVMTYELALFELMKGAHSISGQTQAREMLARYIVLFEKMIERDPTSLLLVKNMGRFQQFIEGSARYVEHFAARNSIYPSINEDPTHGWDTSLDTLTSGSSIRHIFAVRTWYHVGSGVIHLLKEAGVPVHQLMMAGETPYDIAIDLLNLTDQEKDTLHSQMIGAIGWNAYVQQANYLHSLL